MEPNEEQLQALAKRRVEARLGLVANATMYVVVNLALVVIWGLTGSGYPWFIWPMMGWGVGLVAHAFALWFGPDSPHGQRAIDRELHRLHAHH